MKMQRIISKFRWYSKWCMSDGMLLCSVLPFKCLADKSIFCGAADQLKKIQIIPIAQMDNDMLYESVKSILDGNMSSEQRLLNHYWMLLENPSSTTSANNGDKILAVSFTTYYDSAWHTLDIGKADPHAEEHTALLGLFGDYQVRVSREALQVGLNKRF